MSEFASWFENATRRDSSPGFVPHSWQKALASSVDCENSLIRVPTGMGKTLGVLATWIFHRIERQDKTWPVRLVWCLPMRTLAEQTEKEAKQVLERLSVGDQVDVHVLMGGIEEDRWYTNPERSAIFIGTQDMLLSRALNRGYGMGAAAWPRAFGLLNSDALWVMDEVQLMGVGLASSAQLQSFWEEDRRNGRPLARPRVTWWMSATLQPDWLATPETASFLPQMSDETLRIASVDRVGKQWDAKKPIHISESTPATWSDQICSAHADHDADSETGRQTLVVVNTVRQAIQLFDDVSKKLKGSKSNVKLIHSRFRRHERNAWSQFLSRNALSSEVDRILIATQVVEAGVDISSSCLITQLAPWPSLVQRAGRAARYGGTARVIVLDARLEGKRTLPYDEDELNAAREALQKIEGMSIRELEEFEECLAISDTELLGRLYPYEPLHILLRHEFEELFDTSPDLSGANMDVSRFIREGDMRDVQVFWREWDADRPSPSLQPRAEELCPVPIADGREWIEEVADKVWAWDYLDGQWKKAANEPLRPGMTLLAAPEAGGYESNGRGFVATKSKRTVEVVPTNQTDVDLAERTDESEQASEAVWKTIGTHNQEAQIVCRGLADSSGLNSRFTYLLELAMRLHDWGKAHPAFAEGTYLVTPECRNLAKAPRNAWRPLHQFYDTPTCGPRKGFRHELASCLAALELLRGINPQHAALLGDFVGLLNQCGRNPEMHVAAWNDNPIAMELNELSANEFNLLLFLILCHHGKVRASLQASPKDQEFPYENEAFVGAGMPIRGVREGDEVPSIALPSSTGELIDMPSTTLSLAVASMGLSSRYGRSWSERLSGLLAHYGPFVLSYLEAIVRAADGQASDDRKSPGRDSDARLKDQPLAVPTMVNAPDADKELVDGQ